MRPDQIEYIGKGENVPPGYFGVPLKYGEWIALMVSGKAGELYTWDRSTGDTVAYYSDECDAISVSAQVDLARQAGSSFLSEIRDQPPDAPSSSSA